MYVCDCAKRALLERVGYMVGCTRTCAGLVYYLFVLFYVLTWNIEAAALRFHASDEATGEITECGVGFLAALHMSPATVRHPTRSHRIPATTLWANRSTNYGVQQVSKSARSLVARELLHELWTGRLIPEQSTPSTAFTHTTISARSAENKTVQHPIPLTHLETHTQRTTTRVTCPPTPSLTMHVPPTLGYRVRREYKTPWGWTRCTTH